LFVEVVLGGAKFGLRMKARMHSLSWDYRGALPELPSAQALIRLGAQKIFEQKGA